MRHEDFHQKLLSDQEFATEEERLRPLYDFTREVLTLRLEKGWSQSELARRQEPNKLIFPSLKVV